MDNTLVTKWGDILNHDSCSPIRDTYKKRAVAMMLENQEKATNLITEATTPPATSTGSGIQNWQPVLISMVRRSAPNLMAFDIAGVQPMNGPVALIFAMKSHYGTQSGPEALHNESDPAFSGVPVPADNLAAHVNGVAQGGPSTLGGLDQAAMTIALALPSATPANIIARDLAIQAALGDAVNAGNVAPATAALANNINDTFANGTGMSTNALENLGLTGNPFQEMAITIERATVTAKARALKARYSNEVAQDADRVHAIDMETEFATMLSTEILAEQNREMIRTINVKAKLGFDGNYAGFDLTANADGRWSGEKYKGLAMQIQKEANVIARDTRRGKGNWIVCSSNVASALANAKKLDFSAGAGQLDVDDSASTFAGILDGKIKVFIDQYAHTDYVTVGYRGVNPYDAGIFYCPYTPLEIYKTKGEEDFQPRIGFSTRYGMAANPFALTYVNGIATSELGDNRNNPYFRIFAVTGI